MVGRGNLIVGELKLAVCTFFYPLKSCWAIRHWGVDSSHPRVYLAQSKGWLVKHHLKIAFYVLTMAFLGWLILFWSQLMKCYGWLGNMPFFTALCLHVEAILELTHVVLGLASALLGSTHFVLELTCKMPKFYNSLFAPWNSFGVDSCPARVDSWNVSVFFGYVGVNNLFRVCWGQLLIPRVDSWTSQTNVYLLFKAVNV